MYSWRQLPETASSKMRVPSHTHNTSQILRGQDFQALVKAQFQVWHLPQTPRWLQVAFLGLVNAAHHHCPPLPEIWPPLHTQPLSLCRTLITTAMHRDRDVGLLESQVGSRWSLCSRGPRGGTMITLGRVWARRVNNEEFCVGGAKTLRRRSECVQVCLYVCARMCSAKEFLGLATQRHYLCHSDHLGRLNVWQKMPTATRAKGCLAPHAHSSCPPLCPHQTWRAPHLGPWCQSFLPVGFSSCCLDPWQGTVCLLLLATILWPHPCACTPPPSLDWLWLLLPICSSLGGPPDQNQQTQGLSHSDLISMTCSGDDWLIFLLLLPDHELLGGTLAPAPWVLLKIQSLRQRSQGSWALWHYFINSFEGHCTNTCWGKLLGKASWRKLAAHGPATLSWEVPWSLCSDKSLLTGQWGWWGSQEPAPPGISMSHKANTDLFRRLCLLPAIATPSRVTIHRISAKNHVHLRVIGEGLAAWLITAVHQAPDQKPVPEAKHHGPPKTQFLSHEKYFFPTILIWL